MSLRWRIAIALGALAAIAVAIASVGAYVATRDQLRESLDRSLRVSAADIGRGPDDDPGGPPDDESDDGPDDGIDGIDGIGACPPEALFSPATTAQLVSPDGEITVCISGGAELPVPDDAPADGEVRLSSITLDGVPHRVAATPFHSGGVLQIARSEADERDVLDGLVRRLVLITLLVTAGAAAAGWLIAQRLVRPVIALRDATRRIALDHDFTQPVSVKSTGEIRELATSFEAMVDALATSREQQRRLVADASHEMRTPLTSLTANLDLIDRYDRLEPADRPEVLGAVRSDVDDLTALMTELVDLAADRTSDAPVVDVDLADLAEGVAARARRRTGRAVTLVVESIGTVPGRVAMLERAISNLVDNAHKYSPPGAPIEIVTGASRVQVVDHGPGIPADERALVFERFWRADTARNLPGSGLGLAIVRQVVDRHGGTVTVTDTPSGGATFTIDLPTG